VSYKNQQDFELVGWNSYMTPEAAAKGVYLMGQIPTTNADLSGSAGYSDLSTATAYQDRDPRGEPQRDI
jgi:hypothetical protein